MQIANSSVDDCKVCKDPHCRNYNVKVWSTYYILSTVYINKLLRHRPRLGSSQLEQQSAAAAYICVLPLTVAAVWLGPDLLLVLGLVMYEELQLLRCATTGISAIANGQVLNIIAAN